jgi:hypothetical protein
MPSCCVASLHSVSLGNAMLVMHDDSDIPHRMSMIARSLT